MGAADNKISLTISIFLGEGHSSVGGVEQIMLEVQTSAIVE